MMEDDADKWITLTDPQVDRYASLRLINWWDQDRISSAHVMVVGAGALGNEVLKNLALIGVGHLLIVDFDQIEASNLTRSVLFRASDGGQSKALIAAERVRAINADVQVLAIHGDVTREIGTGVYLYIDVVIGCLDNRAARLAVNRACWSTGTPWIDGGLDAVNGLMRAFVPHTGACYECTFSERDYQLLDTRYSCTPGFRVIAGRQPTLPTTASLIAAMQVQEAIKLLHALPVRAGGAFYYSWQTLQVMHIHYPVRQNCPAHVEYQPLISLPAAHSGMSLAQLAATILPYTQEDAVLFLSENIITWCYCPGCLREEQVYRPRLSVRPAGLICPHCGTERTYDVTGTLAIAHLVEEIPLGQLGIPPLHILPVRSRAGWQYFELSADRPVIFASWSERSK
jgi:molybdopterin-synthase adenylyltransferase